MKSAQVRWPAPSPFVRIVECKSLCSLSGAFRGCGTQRPLAAAVRVAGGRPHMEPAVFLNPFSELLLRMKAGDVLPPHSAAPPPPPPPPVFCMKGRLDLSEPGERRCRDGVPVPPRSGVAVPRDSLRAAAFGLPKPLAVVVLTPVVRSSLKVPARASVAEGAKVLQVARASPPPGFFASVAPRAAAAGTAAPPIGTPAPEATPSLSGSRVFWFSAGSSCSGRSSSAKIARSRLPSVPWSSKGPRRRAVIRTSEKCTSSWPPLTEEEL
mmetsp:Transcript_118566/g.369324  ORF Transcript_118566/g.369324 Transcript_118566/m.369324 type:complete len:267 (+) Transcript_118566:47-847(+)